MSQSTNVSQHFGAVKTGALTAASATVSGALTAASATVSGALTAATLSVTAPARSVQLLTGTGNLTSSITMNSEVHSITTTGASTIALANGVAGQVKTFILIVDGGNLVITPANFSATTITFANAYDTATLVFVSGEWVPISLVGAVVA